MKKCTEEEFSSSQAEALLKRSADPNLLLPTQGVTPFHLAVGVDRALDFVKLILSYGGNPNQVCVQSGCTSKVFSCSNPLGMESGKIWDRQIRPSSSSINQAHHDSHGSELEGYMLEYGQNGTSWERYVDKFGGDIHFCGTLDDDYNNVQHLPLFKLLEKPQWGTCVSSFTDQRRFRPERRFIPAMAPPAHGGQHRRLRNAQPTTRMEYTFFRFQLLQAERLVVRNCSDLPAKATTTIKLHQEPVLNSTSRYRNKIQSVGIEQFLLSFEQFDDETALPPVAAIDLALYLVLHTSLDTQERFKVFKILEAYNYVVSGFVDCRECRGRVAW
ncbi:hypothetical protein Bbelb_109290 [Branchiostoma belcheri]|nr:hypothetical protein Bbelb_109290 [Branchiostoma belcheri]